MGLASIGRPLIILHHRGSDILEHAKALRWDVMLDGLPISST